jgi:hypothetical protein
MFKQMRKMIEFVNVDGVFHEITNIVVSCDYNMVMLMAAYCGHPSWGTENAVNQADILSLTFTWNQPTTVCGKKIATHVWM